MRSSTLGPAAVLSAYERGQALSPAARAVRLFKLASAQAAVDNVLDASIGARDTALFALRSALFGPAFESIAECSACGSTIELEFSSESIRASAAPSGTLVRIREGTREYSARLPTSRDLIAIEGMSSVEEAAELLFERCLVDPSGASPSPEIRTRLAQAMTEADSAADISLQVTCPECGAETILDLDIARHLWTEIERWAEETFDDVDSLASAYGWSEEEILALGPVRRRAYLERASGRA